MLKRDRCTFGSAALATALVPSVSAARTTRPSNTCRMVAGRAKTPEGRRTGSAGGVGIDPGDRHVWAFIRCDASARDPMGDECLDPDVHPVFQFDMDGRVVESFGGAMFIWPHGIDAAPAGDVRLTDAPSPLPTTRGERGRPVIKSSPTAEVLMVLGPPREQGRRPHCTSPANVVVADNGNLLVARPSRREILRKQGSHLRDRFGIA